MKVARDARLLFLWCCRRLWPSYVLLSSSNSGVGVIATCFDQKQRPTGYDQLWLWIRGALPGGESVYMLRLAAICWAIWKTCNVVCFENKILRNPLEILCSTCAFICYWAGLYPKVMKEVIENDVDQMLQTTIKLLGKKTRVAGPVMAIEDKKRHI
jgi:hypothetical protein